MRVGGPQVRIVSGACCWMLILVSEMEDLVGCSGEDSEKKGARRWERLGRAAHLVTVSWGVRVVRLEKSATVDVDVDGVPVM